MDYNNHTSISDLNNIPFGFSAPKKTKSAQIAARKIVQKYKKLSKKKLSLPFNISDIANADETVDYNDDTNINDVSSNKGAQIAAKKIVKKYRNLARKNHTKDLPKKLKMMLYF